MIEEVIDHDTACAQEIGKRFELGCFEEQINIYATCFYKNSETYYFMSDNAENTYNFFEKKLQENVYCLPIVRRSTSQLIPSGEKEDIIRNNKIETGINVMKIHGSDIVKKIENLAPQKNSSGVTLLEEIKVTLAGCFAPESLQVFSGLVNLTYYAGKISYFDFVNYHNWLRNVQKTVENETIVHDVHERDYSGFAYIDKQGTWKYYYNAVKASTLQRQSELRKERIIVTPLFEKRYCFNRIDELPIVTEKFKQQLKIAFDKNYMNILQYIYYDLPGSVNKEIFLQCCREAEDKEEWLLLESLNYYGTLWQVW